MFIKSRFVLILNGMAVAILIATYASYRIASGRVAYGTPTISQELQLLPIQASASAHKLACARLSCVIATRAELGLSH